MVNWKIEIFGNFEKLIFLENEKQWEIETNGTMETIWYHMVP